MTIKGRQHYTMLSGSYVNVPVLNDDGDEIGHVTHTVHQDVCIFIEDVGDIETVPYPHISVL